MNTYREEKQKSYQERWWDTAWLHIKMYDKITQVLNKYGILFDSQPQGYSNVSMKSV